ncbi:hypothetical protein vseg_016994 [Gypsophila vaccaria]
MAKLLHFTCLALLLALALVAHSEDCVQVIHLKTGDVSDAGTNAGVSLKLYDAQGNYVVESNIWERGIMDSGHDYFERNNLDLFAFKTECLSSKVCKIELRHDNSGSKSGWYVSYLQVTTGILNAQCTQTKFQIDQWLATDEPPYSLSLSRDLCDSSRLHTNNTLSHSLLNLPTST